MEDLLPTQARGLSPSLFHALEWWSRAMVGASFALALVAAAAAARHVSRASLASLPWWPILSGLGLRIALGPFALVHENRHGYSAAFVQGEPLLMNRVHGVVSSHYAGASLLQQGLNPDWDAVFLWNLGWSTVAVVAVGAIAGSLAGRLAGSAAAWLVAVQPLAVLMASTEEFTVAAAGMGLAGVALVVAAREQRPGSTWLLLLATALIALAASTRDVLLLLSLLLPVTLLATAPRSGPWPWVRWGSACGLLFVLLLPRAMLLVALASADHHSRSLVNVPALPLSLSFGRLLDPGWIGWQAPWIAPAAATLAVCGAIALSIVSSARRDWRTPLALLGTVAVFHASGGLVNFGWFPSMLRHQAGSMVAWMIPAGWLLAWIVGRSERRLGDRSRRLLVVLLAIPIASVGGTYVFDTPGTREFHLLQEGLDRADDGPAAFISTGDLERDVLHLDAWVAHRKPAWRVMSAAEYAADPAARAMPAHFVLDRICFFQLPPADGTTGPSLPGIEDTPTPYGRMRRSCADLLDLHPWNEVASVDIHHPGFPFDFPPFEPDHRLAWFTWHPPEASPEQPR